MEANQAMLQSFSDSCGVVFDQSTAMELSDAELVMMVAQAQTQCAREARSTGDGKARIDLFGKLTRELQSKECECVEKCEAAWSDTCYGSHGYCCEVWYRQTERMLTNHLASGSPVRSEKGNGTVKSRKELTQKVRGQDRKDKNRSQDRTLKSKRGSQAEAADRGVACPVGDAGEAPEGATASAAPSGVTVGDHPVMVMCHGMPYEPSETEMAELRESLAESERVEKSEEQRLEEYEHIRGGHRTKLSGGRRCAHCMLAKMIDRGAKRGSTRDPYGLMTCCVDTDDMVCASVNGNRYFTTAVLRGSQLGQIQAGASKDAISTARRWRKMKTWFEVISDPGGTQKIQVMQRDPGTEFQGAVTNEREAENVFDFVGEKDRHTHASLAENRQRMLLRTATAMSLTAFQGDHDQYEELATAAWCESIRAANAVTNHHPITAEQHKAGLSAIEEQSKGRVSSKKYLKDLVPFGTLVYGFAPKRLRKGKLSRRSFKAIFCGKDDDVLGTFRVMPFEAREGKWKLYPTVVVGKLIAADEVFPLRANPAEETSIQRCDRAWEKIFDGEKATVLVSAWELAAADSIEEQKVEEPQTKKPEVDDVVGRMTDTAGMQAYELTWKGFDRGDSTWHYEDGLHGCKTLVDEFEARIAARGESDALEVYAPRESEDEMGAMAVIFGGGSGEMKSTQEIKAVTTNRLEDPVDQVFVPDIKPYVMAVTEIEVQTFLTRAGGPGALEKEWKAMTAPAFGGQRPRLIEMSDQEAAPFKDSQGKAFKGMLKLRYACTVKRATPQQLDAEPNAAGKDKARLVAQDLKLLNPADPVDTYAPVPEGCVFRLMVAAHPIVDYDISATDVTTAYLQGDCFPYDPTNARSTQWVPCKVYDPVAKRWRFLYMTGEIYGRQPAGCTWHKTLTRKHKKVGMEEGKNAKSIYFNEKRTVKTAVHVDDPVNYAKRTEAYPKESSLKLDYYEKLSAELDLKEVETLSRDQDLDYLSLRMSVSEKDEVCISNADFIFKVIERHGMSACNPATTPISKDLLKIVGEEAELGQFLNAEDTRQYQADVGELNWIAHTFCPRLAVTVSLLGKRYSKPTISGPKMVKQAIRWLAGNVDMCLMTDSQDKSGLVTYCDSDHAGMQAVDGDRRSRMGIVVTYNGMVVFWHSAWIKAICLSSAEAEVYALGEAAKIAVHLKWICQELHIDVARQVTIRCDATAAMSFASNLGGASQSKPKHIDLRRGFVEQLRDTSEIEIVKILGTVNPANFFTKVLSASEFKREGDPLMGKVELGKAMTEMLRIRGHGDKAGKSQASKSQE